MYNGEAIRRDFRLPDSRPGSVATVGEPALGFTLRRLADYGVVCFPNSRLILPRRSRSAGCSASSKCMCRARSRNPAIRR